MNKIIMNFFIVFALIITISCGQNKVLIYTNWKLEYWSISSIEASKYEITALFNNSLISGKSAVNSYSGEYILNSDGTFSVDKISSNQMGGLDSNANRAESIYFDLLKEVRKAKIENNNLILLDNFDNELLIFKKN